LLPLQAQTALYAFLDVVTGSQQREVIEAQREAARLKEKAKRDEAKQRQRQAARAVAVAAQGQLLQLSSKKRSRDSRADKHGDVQLPDAVLQHIMVCLAM
jgi:hypothetical protein